MHTQRINDFKNVLDQVLLDTDTDTDIDIDFEDC